MENASKALLIAGGILMAILIVSVGIITYRNISDASQSTAKREEAEQLAKFNAQYEAFNRDDLTGFEMITLINKAIDYNIRNAQDPDKNYPRIDITINLNTNTAAANEGKKTYTTTTIPDGQFKSGNIKSEFFTTEIPRIEGNYGKTIMSKFASIFSDIKDKTGAERENVILEKNIETSNIPTDTEIEKYEAYLEFKREENFKCEKVEYDKNSGRIKYLEFKQAE